MKFALRDDDLNYFFSPKDIDKWYQNIWNVCPVSMSAIPFVKGNWKENTAMLEELGPNNLNDEVYSKIKKDTKIFKLGDNIDLKKNLLKIKISEGKIYITMHGVEHRNGDKVLPNVKNNFSIGAEFFTDRDLSNKVKKAKKYLEEIFGQTISVFTPPQKILLNYKGIEAIVNNDLAICGDLPSLRKLRTINLIGFTNFMKCVFFRLKENTNIYPFPITNNKFKYITHFRLQPGTNIKLLYEMFDEVYSCKGNFVLSTHSYGFDHKMKNSNETMQVALENFIKYAYSKKSIKFVNLNKVFNIKKLKNMEKKNTQKKKLFLLPFKE